jgi:type III restriction enzyme
LKVKKVAWHPFWLRRELECRDEHPMGNPGSEGRRAVGNLWAERSRGRCIFVMPKGRDFDAIRWAIEA